MTVNYYMTYELKLKGDFLMSIDEIVAKRRQRDADILKAEEAAQ